VNKETLMFTPESFAGLIRRPVEIELSEDLVLFADDVNTDNRNTDDMNKDNINTDNLNTDDMNTDNANTDDLAIGDCRDRVSVSANVGCIEETFKNTPILNNIDLISESTSDQSPSSSAISSDNYTKSNASSIINENNLFIDDLYFVTKNGALELVPSKCMNWILNKISSEVEFDDDLSDINVVEDLRLRVIDKYSYKLSTYDLIQIYIKYDLCNQLYIVSNDKK
jgi:hypothetical protein